MAYSLDEFAQREGLRGKFTEGRTVPRFGRVSPTPRLPGSPYPAGLHVNAIMEDYYRERRMAIELANTKHWRPLATRRRHGG